MIRRLLLSLALLPSLALPAVTHVGTGTSAVATNTNTANPTIHASTTTNDVIILIVGYTHDNADGGSINAVSGYTSLEEVLLSTGDFDLEVLCKVAGASESSPSVNAADGGSGTGDVIIAQAFTIRGALADCASIVAHVAESTTTGNVNDLPHVGLTVTTANTAVIAIGAKRDDVTSVDTLATDSLSWAEVAEATTTTGDDATIVADMVVQTTAASIGSGSFTLVPATGQTGRHASILLSLKPAAGGGPGSPPTGKDDITVASVAANTWCADFNTAVDPDIAAGDTIRIDEATSPGGFTLTHGTNCSLEYSGDDSRQFVEYEIYDTSAAGWMAGGTGLLVFNNVGATCDQPAELILDVGSAMSSFDLDDLCIDAEADALTYAVTSGILPTGLTLTGATGVISGTPTVENESGAALTITATDPYGATATQSLTIHSIDTITVPDCDGLTGGECDAALTAVFLTSATTYDCSDSVATGYVASISPLAATEQEPFTEIMMTVSNGSCFGLDEKPTTFLADASPVPSTAVFVGGAAYAQDGTQYVAAWPSNNKVKYIGGLVYRDDGALVISVGGTITTYRTGIGLTYRGETVAAVCSPTYSVAKVPMIGGGTVCMTDVN